MFNHPDSFLVTFLTEDFITASGRAPHPPMGALYLAGALRKAGFRPHVLHLLPSHLNQLKTWIETEQPSWVGFSSLTGPMIIPTLEASVHAKRLGIPVVWGGVHASMLPDLCLKEAADYVVSGEGEETVVELARAITGGDKAPEIAGLSHLKNGIRHGPPRAPVNDLDLYPPAWDMIEPAQYIKPDYPGGAMPFMFSRGCPHRCRFCYNETMRAGRWRRHSDEYLSDTVDFLRSRVPFSVLELQDDFLFESTKSKSISWIEVLGKKGLKWVASFRPKALTPEFARWIEEHGCIEVRIGMESGHPETLERLGKTHYVQDLYSAAEALAKTSIRGMAGFVINWPGENRESILASLRATDDLARINPRLRFNLGYYIPMPGTPIYRDALSDGFREPSSLFEWARIFDHPYRYRGFSPNEIETMELISGRLYRHYMKPWPMQRLLELSMRWRWRHAYFKWFGLRSIRRVVKNIEGILATLPSHK